MLANPHHSRLVLVNPGRKEPGEIPAGLVERRRESLGLLRVALEIFDVVIDVTGEYQIGQMASGLDKFIKQVDLDALSLWQDARFARSLATTHVGVVFLAGAWLEEEVLVLALEGVKLGYDVRVLADLAVARIESDRALVFDRLALHGVPAMTVRQTILEWAMCLEDPAVKRRVRQLLA